MAWWLKLSISISSSIKSGGRFCDLVGGISPLSFNIRSNTHQEKKRIITNQQGTYQRKNENTRGKTSRLFELITTKQRSYLQEVLCKINKFQIACMFTYIFWPFAYHISWAPLGCLTTREARKECDVLFLLYVSEAFYHANISYEAIRCHRISIRPRLTLVWSCLFTQATHRSSWFNYISTFVSSCNIKTHVSYTQVIMVQLYHDACINFQHIKAQWWNRGSTGTMIQTSGKIWI